MPPTYLDLVAAGTDVDGEARHGGDAASAGLQVYQYFGSDELHPANNAYGVWVLSRAG